MDRHQLLIRHIRILFIVVFISQVGGNPAYYWSPQPDCDQVNGYQQSEYQPNEYQPNTYQQPDYQQNSQEYNQQSENQRNDYQDQNGYVYEKPTGYQNSLNYPAPSYQETLQSMIEETIKALTEIVQVTVRASKQELSSLAKMFFDSIPKTLCNSENESENDPDENNSGVDQFDGGNKNPSSISPVRPLKGNLIEQEALNDNNTLSSTSSSSESTQSTTSLTTSTSKETSSSTITKEITTVSSSSPNPTSTTLGEIPSSIPSEEISPYTSENSSKPINIGEQSGTENSLALNSTSLKSQATTQNPVVDKSDDISSKAPFLLSSTNESVINNEVTTIYDDSFMTVDSSLKNSTMTYEHTLSPSLNESSTSLLISTPTEPGSTETDLTLKHGNTESSNETFSSTLPSNTHITTTYIPPTLLHEPQNDSNTQNNSTVQTSTENLQLTTTDISAPLNETANVLPDRNSTGEHFTDADKPTTSDEYYEQAPDNDVDSDAIDFRRNPKL